jgi:hypothetical protein
MTSGDEPNGRDNNRPTIEITYGDNGEVKATAAIEIPVHASLLRDRDSVASVSAGEFDDVDDDLKCHFDVTRSARDRKIHVSVASYPGDNEGDVAVQSFLTVEFTRCDATDPRCNDVIGAIINDAIDELRKWLLTELESYAGGA